MVSLADIHSLTDFQRNAKKYVTRLKKTGRPHVLTVNGRAELVVQDARSYQRLLELLERADTITAIKSGLADVKAGRTKPAAEVLDELRSMLKMPRQA